jgi:protease-4
MKFAGMVWRFLRGVKDALVLIFMLLFFGVLYAALSASPHSGSAQSGALLLDFSGSIVEQPSEQSPVQLISGTSMAREHRLRDVIRALDAAATDDRIRAVALDLDSFVGGGQAAMANVADALDRVRRANKPVIAYATGYSDDAYQLAAHASEVWIHPLGGVLIAGRGGTNLYYAGLMERLGVTANVFRVGTYKSAIEPFTRSDMSPESREQSQALANALWQQWLDDVQRARPRAQIAPYAADPNRFITAAGGSMAHAAIRGGLADRIGDRTAFGRRMAEVAGTDTPNLPGSFRTVRFDAWTAANPSSHSGGQIGVLTIAGNIVDGRAGPGTAGAESVVRNLERGLRGGNLRALVVRVDSPGGSVTGSERIRRAIRAARERGIPVVVSFGSVAASGGYWIATVGDTILAEPSTITGSIGVFGILPSFERTLQRIGVGADGVGTTPLSGQPDIFRGISPQTGQIIQMGIDNTYRNFLLLVSGRADAGGAGQSRLRRGASGTAAPPASSGLVDQFGSLSDAIAEAARRARIDPEDARPVFLEPASSWFSRTFGSFARARATISPDPFGRLAQRPQALLRRALTERSSCCAAPPSRPAASNAPPPTKRSRPPRGKRRLAGNAAEPGSAVDAPCAPAKAGAQPDRGAAGPRLSPGNSFDLDPPYLPAARRAAQSTGPLTKRARSCSRVAQLPSRRSPATRRPPCRPDSRCRTAVPECRRPPAPAPPPKSPAGTPPRGESRAACARFGTRSADRAGGAGSAAGYWPGHWARRRNCSWSPSPPGRPRPPRHTAPPMPATLPAWRRRHRPARPQRAPPVRE